MYIKKIMFMMLVVHGAHMMGSSAQQRLILNDYDKEIAEIQRQMREGTRQLETCLTKFDTRLTTVEQTQSSELKRLNDAITFYNQKIAAIPTICDISLMAAGLAMTSVIIQIFRTTQ